MTIGGIQPMQEVTVKLQLIKKLEIEAGAYALRIPTPYFIKFGNEKIGINKGIKESELQDDDSKYSFRITLNTQHPLTYVSMPSHSKILKLTESEPSKQTIIEKLNANVNDLKKDITVYFRTQKMDSPQLLAQVHPTNKDLIACMVSLVPTFTPQ